MECVAAVLFLCVCVLVSMSDGNVDAGERNLIQFREMIKCVLPNSSPLEDFGNYGCYCGLGGQGTPVDQLDQCCFVHDGCYSQAKNLSSCGSPFDSPYTNIYKFQCDSSTNTVTCLNSNSACDMFICECDRVASACFGVTPYNASNNDLPSSVCKSGSRASGSSVLTALTLTLLSLKLTSTA
ncbi:phospholipase A2-like [Salminus brasiliensis]|uniref:phospholipase A2-like n=1 Tax=Salminus brasiliensis TaxID=930266 RepID=UPI003B833380